MKSLFLSYMYFHRPFVKTDSITYERLLTKLFFFFNECQLLYQQRPVLRNNEEKREIKVTNFCILKIL
jgi:hypothetical protein